MSITSLDLLMAFFAGIVIGVILVHVSIGGWPSLLSHSNDGQPSPKEE